MLNLLRKTAPWIVASLATSVFGQDGCAPARSPKSCCCQPKPCPPWPEPNLIPAYNHSARVETSHPWDVWGEASFIYWQPVQENMDVGLVLEPHSLPVTYVRVAPFTVGPTTSFSALDMDFKFKPGFKVGAGWKMNHDMWDAHLEYTWFHCKQHRSKTADIGSTGIAPSSPPGFPVQVNTGGILPTWGFPFVNTYDDSTAADQLGSLIFESAEEKWHLNMDLLELDVGRWCYTGCKLTFRPAFGLRAACIRQHANVVYSNTRGLGVSVITQLATPIDKNEINARTNSWGIGPKIALDTNWAVGKGFRFFGDMEADILYTRYTKLSMSQQNTMLAGLPGFNSIVANPVKYKDHRGALRTHLELELGLGWGTYFDCNNWYLDLSAGYEFQVFYDQNMFKHFDSTLVNGSGSLPYGNLYIQGLNVTARLDF